MIVSSADFILSLFFCVQLHKSWSRVAALVADVNGIPLTVFTSV